MNTNPMPTTATTALPPGYSDRLMSAFQHPHEETRLSLIDQITDELVAKGVCRPRGSIELFPAAVHLS